MDSWEGRSRDPLTLHKYLYTGNNPINGSDPSGNITLVEVAEVALITAIVIIGGGGTITSGFGLLGATFNTGKNNLPLVSIATQPILIEGSSWNEDDAYYAMSGAKAIWKALANIHIDILPAIKIPIPNYGPPPNFPVINQAIQSNQTLLNRKKIKDQNGNYPFDAKHFTVFAESTGWFSYGKTIPGKSPSVIGVNALNRAASEDFYFLKLASFSTVLQTIFNRQTPGAFTVAHEWGHTFGLEHEKAFGTLMSDNPLPGGSAIGLSSADAKTANANASSYR